MSDKKVSSKLEQMLNRRLKAAGLHAEGSVMIAVLQFPPEGSVAWYQVYGIPQDEYAEVMALVKTKEFMSFGGKIDDGMIDVLWMENVEHVVGKPA